MNVMNVVAEQDAKLGMIKIRWFIPEYLLVVLRTSRGERRMDGHDMKRHETRFDCNLPLCVITEECEQACNGRR